ncbi:hypothetical protein BSR28_01045 [Boudabousia liubingyangii]|uniref:hypothetical protein n=1 Tax=Boudabousia liubingyangii TaxID=1921764 RepID=UPI00093A28E2|nr:hypothetical protein [Boudabousia liubingyangii]OKL48323.1 hypothetical protein BSR28_01045 [Boudabousia liubingyangii]
MAAKSFNRDGILDPVLAAALEPAFEGATFHLHEDGTAFAGRATDTYTLATDWFAGQALPTQLAGGHLLFFPADVSPDEVEALCVSLWDEAGWLSPGILGLYGDVTLTGPWEVTRQVRQALKLPANAASAFTVQLPREREAISPDAPEDPLDPLFRFVMPAGEEYETVAQLVEIARRLGGGVRSDMGLVYEPDPDAAVNLYVYAPAWLPAEDLIKDMRDLVPQLKLFGSRAQAIEEAKQAPMTHLPSLGAALTSRVALRHLEEAGISTEELEQLNAAAAAFDRIALSTPREGSNRAGLTGTREGEIPSSVPLALGVRTESSREEYLLTAPVGHGAAVVVETFSQVEVPAALRWEDWAQGPVVVYEVRWEPSDPQRAYLRSIPRTLRVERMNATTVVEAIAAHLVARVGGSAVDDAGFLVTF